jgi:putative SOS response-associated peptidase YedK
LNEIARQPTLVPNLTGMRPVQRVAGTHVPIPPQLDLPISYNIAPKQNVLAIRRHPETGERSLDPLRWGLTLNWAKEEKIAYKTIRRLTRKSRQWLPENRDLYGH